MALIVTFPLVVLIYRQMRSLVKSLLREITDADTNTASQVVEYTQGLPVLRATKQVGERSQCLQAALVHQRDVQSKRQRLVNLPLTAMATVVEVGIFTVISLGTLFRSARKPFDSGVFCAGGDRDAL